MPAEPRWLSLERLIKINRAEVEATGERHLLRDPGLLESAWAKPRNRHLYQGEADVVRLAVALLDGICQNHCFEQGNKRTAEDDLVAFLKRFLEPVA